MSLLGKYRKEEEKSDDDERRPGEATASRTTTTKQAESTPNKERKSPIVSFSITTNLRSCLKAVRSERAINLSMWVERKLREAIEREFPDIANQFLEG